MSKHKGKSDLFKVVSLLSLDIFLIIMAYSFYAETMPLILGDLQVIYTSVAANGDLQWCTSSNRLTDQIAWKDNMKLLSFIDFITEVEVNLQLVQENEQFQLRSCHHYSIKIKRLLLEQRI